MAIAFSKNFLLRLVTALAALPFVLVPVWMGGTPLLLLLLLATVLMAAEWAHLTGHEGSKLAILASIIVASAPVVLVAFVDGIDDSFVRDFLAFAALLFAASFLFVKRVPKLIWPLVGGVYIGFLMLPVYWLRGMGSGDGNILLVWILFAVWGMDVGGYFAGKGIGGPKLAPVISPKKTWAGLVGGMLLGAMVCVAITLIFDWWTPLVSGLAGALVAGAAQIGDLYESALKRHFGVKDSGALLPGHGGILDRVDGLVFGVGGVGLALATHFT